MIRSIAVSKSRCGHRGGQNRKPSPSGRGPAAIAAEGHCPVATGRVGSVIQSLHEPG